MKLVFSAQRKHRAPDHLSTYFYQQVPLLVAITVTGTICNAGLIAGPYFEGRLAQCLFDILQGTAVFSDMLYLALLYFLTILFVQTLRFFKRWVVRKFSNRIGLSLKSVIYNNLVHLPSGSAESADAGAHMTRAVSDSDACAEGMRKVTTEIFDTGVVMISYIGMLCYYDWRLTLICLCFPPAAYLIASGLRKVVTSSTAAARDAAGKLNGATLDRISNAMTYRVYGQEENRGREYEKFLKEYEKRSILANLWESSLMPLYRVIALASTVFILWQGGKSVTGGGWAVWDIAAFSTYLACYLKLARKASRSARLFNSVQKAKVSWQRIKPFLKEVSDTELAVAHPADELKVSNVSLTYPDGQQVLNNVSFSARKGQIIGITGPIACGKSSLGRLFLNETPYEGSITYNGVELNGRPSCDGTIPVGYLGHKPELLSASIRENIQLGGEESIDRVLSICCLQDEVASFELGEETPIGEGGIRLSGGQQARIALARTLYHQRQVYVLDDPFAALDQSTEREIFEKLRDYCKDSIVLLISHRLELFPQLDKVLWMENGTVTELDHRQLVATVPEYRRLLDLQGGDAQ